MNVKALKHLDIVLSVFNQQDLIELILHGIFKNTTTPFNLIMVFDGCTDKTEERAKKYIKKYKSHLLKKFIYTTTPNIYETRANNVGFKMATSEFLITLQDDMLINEYGWERRLTYPLRKFDDVLAVTSRIAQNIDRLEDMKHYYTEIAGRECNTLPRNIFAVRDVINRGPIAFNVSLLKQMNYLNESYAPSDLDDADLSLRAWTSHKLRVGAYWINYLSPLHWGKTRASDSTMDIGKSISKNSPKIMSEHGNYLKSHTKHTEDILIPEEEIDYTLDRTYLLPSLFYRPIRISKKDMERFCKQIWNYIKEVLLLLLFKLGITDVRSRGLKKVLTFRK